MMKMKTYKFYETIATGKIAIKPGNFSPRRLGRLAYIATIEAVSVAEAWRLFYRVGE